MIYTTPGELAIVSVPSSQFASRRHEARSIIIWRCEVSSRPLVPVFSPPKPHEIEALALSAAYLTRAGNEAATRLMHTHTGNLSGKLELIATLRDEMRDSAALCECLVAMFDDWGAVSAQ